MDFALDVQRGDLVAARFDDIEGRSADDEVVRSFSFCDIACLEVAFRIVGLGCGFVIEKVPGDTK